MRKTDQCGSVEPTKLSTHNIDAMRVAVLFTPKLPRFHVEARENEIVFAEDAWGRDPEQPGRRSKWGSTGYRDAFWIRDEFLRVTTEREALHFLRDTGRLAGSFDEEPITWLTFQRWQVFTRLAMLRVDAFDGATEALSEEPTDKEKADIASAINLLYEPNGYGANFFNLTEPAFRDGKFTERLIGMLVIANGFFSPLTSSYAIESVPRSLFCSPVAAHELQDAIAESKKNVSQQRTARGSEMQPILVLRPTFTLEAIASTIWTERQAGVSFGRCPGCSEIFRKGSRKDRKFCGDPRCKMRSKKQRNRQNKRDRATMEAPKVV